MRERAKRLAALALSAAMVMSTLVSPVYAAETEGETQATEAQVVEETPAEEEPAEVVEETPAEEETVVEETPAAKAVVTPEETVTEEENTIDTYSQGEAYVVVPETIVFHYNEAGYDDFTVTFQRKPVDGTGDWQYDTATATELKHLDANCYHPGLLWMTVTIDGQTYTSGNVDNIDEAFTVPSEPQREHNLIEVDRQTITPATHLTEGLAHVWYECGYEDCDYTYNTDLVLEKQDHTWGEWVYVAGDNVQADEDGYVVFDESGEPILVDELKDGIYYKTRFCTKDGEEDTANKTELRVYAKKAAYAVIIEQTGIATELVGQRYDYPTADLPIDEATIELENCSKAGSYIVEYYTIEDKPISQEKITVAPHHYNTYLTAEFKSQDDMDQCVVEWNGEELIVTNTSCYLPIEYDEVLHCSAEGCPEKAHEADYEAPQECDGDKVVSRETKTAEPTGDHVIKTSAKRAVEDLVARGDVLYSELKAIADVTENYVQISAQPENNCEEGGEVTVSFICVVDKETVVEEMVVEVIPTGHTRQPAERENYVAPTCTETGSYDAVIKCATCGKELERRENVIIPRIKHTNEVSVGANGVGVDDAYADSAAYLRFVGDKVVDNNGENYEQYQANGSFAVNANTIGEYGKNEFKMTAYVYTNCTTCGEHEVMLADERQATISLTVLEVEKQSESGKAGHITLQATYAQNDVVGGVVTEEITVPYFTSIEAYQGRVEEAPLNGLHLDSDGVYRYYINGEFQEEFTGIVDYAGERFFVTDGVLCSDANGLNLYDNEWYFLSSGQIQRSYTGLALYDGEWFYIVNGKLDDNVTGLVPYNGGTFLFIEGRLAREVNGLWLNYVDDNQWYFLALGQVQTQHTGVAMYDDAFFYVRNGILASDYNGTIEYDGATFNVVAGQLYGPVA